MMAFILQVLFQWNMMRKYDSKIAQMEAAGRRLNTVLKNPREHILSVAQRVAQINYGQHRVNYSN